MRHDGAISIFKQVRVFWERRMFWRPWEGGGTGGTERQL